MQRQSLIGILILTHGELGGKFIETARLIGLNSEERVSAVSIDPSASPDALRGQIGKAIKCINGGRGVLILTDLFGGTPTNLSLSFLEEGRVEVVTGLNLPMMIKAVNSRENHDLATLAKLTTDAGKESIYLAGELFRQRTVDRSDKRNPKFRKE
ncbi:MAG: PTS sugar transporter subunit IIA [Pseudomonadota bacterium]